MSIMDEHSLIWDEIDQAESYLVCCMFDEATILASSILKRLLENYNCTAEGFEVPENFENELDNMLESAGMVLVQSLKHLQRTSEILKELKLIFGLLTSIPFQLFLSGVCFQLSEGLSSTVQGFLEEFLNNWEYVDDRYYLLLGEDARVSDTGRSSFVFSIGVDKYLEIVEIYAVTLLATTVKDLDLAISWVEKAMLPLEKRQDLLRRLQSMSSSTITSSSQISESPQLQDEYKLDFLREQNPYNEHQKDVEYLSCKWNHTLKEEIPKISRHRVPWFWWFTNLNLKFGNVQLVIPSGKMLLVSLLLIMCYITRKKQAMFKRVLAQRALSVKKALLDLWQLAFSYQVNPLAAVQTLPNTTRANS